MTGQGLVENVYVPGLVERNVVAVAVPEEHVFNPLLLPRVERSAACLIPVAGCPAPEEIFQFGTHLGNILGLHFVENVTETQCHVYLLDGSEHGALLELEHIGHDTFAEILDDRCVEAGLVAQAL